jgi:uncharacterized membrane protein
MSALAVAVLLCANYVLPGGRRLIVPAAAVHACRANPEVSPYHVLGNINIIWRTSCRLLFACTFHQPSALTVSCIVVWRSSTAHYCRSMLPAAACIILIGQAAYDAEYHVSSRLESQLIWLFLLVFGAVCRSLA